MTILETLTSDRIELRCPNGPKRLLGVMRIMQEVPRVVEGNLLELACRDCRAYIEQKTGKRQALVVHRYNVIAELIESEATSASGEVKIYPASEVI